MVQLLKVQIWVTKREKQKIEEMHIAYGLNYATNIQKEKDAEQ